MIERHGSCLTLLADIPLSAPVAIAADPADLPNVPGCPPVQFGNFRHCWREPKTFSEYLRNAGRPVTGRICCERVDPVFKAAHVAPPEGVMGDIARTMFYMSETCGFRLSDQDRRFYTILVQQDPPDECEFERNRRIGEIQGRGNPFIERWTGNEKRTCEEMDSCEEARFYLEQCGLSRLDGNGDGVPCESLCR